MYVAAVVVVVVVYIIAVRRVGSRQPSRASPGRLLSSQAIEARCYDSRSFLLHSPTDKGSSLSLHVIMYIPLRQQGTASDSLIFFPLSLMSLLSELSWLCLSRRWIFPFRPISWKFPLTDARTTRHCWQESYFDVGRYSLITEWIWIPSSSHSFLILFESCP
jgi:hypothetical protein